MTSIATSPVVDYLPQASPGLSESLSPRLNSPGPLPLPDFKFPARRPSPTFPSSAPSSFSRATGRRPLSAFELISTPSEEFGTSICETLPQFSFGGGSPLVSPRTNGRPLTAQPHQRNKSEYFGGSVPLITGPTPSGEQSLPPPPASRRHAHRRSAAISQNDLSLILKPSPSSPRGASAPASPAPTSPGYQKSHFASTVDSSIQQPTSSDQPGTPNDESPSKAIKSTKVGFSDDVQIIPRPLSMVSSDSASTVRPGHSVSNSMSSVMSGTSSPPVKDGRSLVPNNNRMSDMRPRTAEPFLDYEQPMSPELSRRGSLPLLSEAIIVASPSPSTPRSLKKWSFFGHESGDSSPKSRPTSSSSANDAKRITMTNSEVVAISAHGIPVTSTEKPGSRRSSISRKPSKKQKKVRSWAGSILGRKSRQRSQKQKLSRRSPTPPLRAFTPMDEAQNFEFTHFDQPSSPKPDLNTDYTTWKPREISQQDEECMSPIIDLDAALGPFNTPSSFGKDWDSSQRSGMRKRAMHSAAGLAGFTGPGMHYHRRAESAPEFENPRFGLNRLGSNSTMAMEDVFEEDEDEDWEDTKASSERDSSIKTGESEEESGSGLGIGTKVVDSEGMDATKQMDFDNDSFQRGIKRKGSASSDGDRRTISSAKSVHSAVSLIDEPIQEEDSSSPVEIVDDSMPSRPESRTQSSDSTATPPFRPHTAKDFSPVDFQSFSLQPPYQTPNSPRSTVPSSAPSPRSPFSYDTQRISTAPSSIADENAFQSLLLGEPGPELRMSVDDVPSLTSSNSTMTRESMGFPGHAQFRDGQRSASLSSAAVTRKRGSMASLSRLISSSHGEKSKLSIESKAPNASESDRKEKTSKSKNRISRLMQFWKPTKETSS